MCIVPPHGERGLKSIIARGGEAIAKSLFLWGAGIEIEQAKALPRDDLVSLSLWGAGIEIAYTATVTLPTAGIAPLTGSGD